MSTACATAKASIAQDGENSAHAVAHVDDGAEKTARVRPKRSSVVDELAGRVQASALTCN